MSKVRSNEEWVNAISKRDAVAFKELSEAIYLWIYNDLRNLPSQLLTAPRLLETAYDCTSETLIRVINRLDQYQHKGPFLGWCRVIALRIVKNWIRSDIQRRKKEATLDEQIDIGVESKDLDSETIDVVEKIMGSLALFLQEGLTHKEAQVFTTVTNMAELKLNREEIAQELGISRNNLDQTWCRARRKVREYLEKSGYTKEVLREYNLL